jgi:hypothetical protein
MHLLHRIPLPHHHIDHGQDHITSLDMVHQHVAEHLLQQLMVLVIIQVNLHVVPVVLSTRMVEYVDEALLGTVNELVEEVQVDNVVYRMLHVLHQ